MRARFNRTGLSVVFQDEDIDKNKLECIIQGCNEFVGFNKPNLILEVKEYVANTGNKESPGFHIDTVPEKTGFDICKEVYVFIDKNIHHQVFFQYDEEFDGGFFITRSPYDRIDISYWTKNKLHWNIQE